MDSTFLTHGIFWMLVFVVSFLIIVVGGIVALIFVGMFSQGLGNIIPGRGAGDQPGASTGGGGPDIPGKVDKHKKVIAAMVEALNNLVPTFDARFEQELQQRGISEYKEDEL